MGPTQRPRAAAVAGLLALAVLGAGCAGQRGFGGWSAGAGCDPWSRCYGTPPGYYGRSYGYDPYGAYRSAPRGGYGPLKRHRGVYPSPVAPPRWGNDRSPRWDGDGASEHHREWLSDVDRRQWEAAERQRGWEDRHRVEQQETDRRLRDASRPLLWPPLPPRPPRGVYPTWERAIRPF